MKSLLSLLLFILLITATQAQPGKQQQSKGRPEKGNKEMKNNTAKGKENKEGVQDKDKMKKHEDVVWEGTHDEGGKGPLPSKNQPAPVRKAFQRDYPNVVNVTWSKYRGDWTATFGNGLLTSTAVYHANGERRDTRTPVQRQDLPERIDDIFKKTPQTKVEDIIKINLPQQVKDIFRIKTITEGQQKFRFFDADGKEINYDY